MQQITINTSLINVSFFQDFEGIPKLPSWLGRKACWAKNWKTTISRSRSRGCEKERRLQGQDSWYHFIPSVGLTKKLLQTSFSHFLKVLYFISYFAAIFDFEMQLISLTHGH